MLGSGADAEDATHDTLERAWRKLVTYDGSGPFGARLQRIASNVCLDGLRARRTRIGPAGYGLLGAPGSLTACSSLPGPTVWRPLADRVKVSRRAAFAHSGLFELSAGESAAVPPGAMTAMSVPARMPGREHHDRGHGRPVPGTEPGRVRICPVRGP